MGELFGSSDWLETIVEVTTGVVLAPRQTSGRAE
jgi:hypothetical protein